MLFLLWIPAVASLILLVAARVSGTLTGKTYLLFGGWYVVAFLLQFFGSSPLARTLGLVLQSALGVVLAVRMKLEL